MKRKALLWIISALIIAAVLVGGYFYSQESQKGEEQKPAKSYNFLLADTTEKRTQGLSGRDFLSDDTVMFFDFEEDDICGIWMKDMKFSIDLVWIDSAFKIIDLKESVAPSTYPEIFSSISPCRYLIEVKEGFVKENAVEIGDKVSVDFNNSTLKITKNLQQP